MEAQAVAAHDEGGAALPAPAAGPSFRRLEYRPALDGLRAVAVYLVVAFHAEMPRFAGGFIGVDTFFVLSGYLVTRLLLSDLARGSFRLLSFYARRVRRLLPAALATLVGVSVLWVLLASPIDRRVVLGDARSAALYVSNWHFAGKATDYFAANENPTPLLHFWSLSVEEQFYVVWPLVVVGLWAWARRRGGRPVRAIGVVCALGATASLAALAWTVHAGSTALAYYGTHTRAYQLLAGAGLACLAHRATFGTRTRRLPATLVQAAALVALLALGMDVVDVGPSTRGVATAAVVLALLWALEAAPAGAGARLLGVTPLTELGKISYGTYLWHYPVIVVLARFVTISPRMLAVVAAVLATALAALSSQLLELPIRRSTRLDRHGRTVVALGLVCSLVAGLLVIPGLLHSRRLPVITAAGSGVVAATSAVPPVSMSGFDVLAAAQLPADFPLDFPTDLSCTTVPLDQCLLTKGSGKKVLLLGDSHAGMLVPALTEIGRQHDLTVMVASMSGCPWQQTLVFTRGLATCGDIQDIWYQRVIPEFDPDVIIVASRATDHAVGADYGVKSNDPSMPKDMSQAMVATADRTLRSLESPDRSLVLIEPVPVGKENTMSCLSGVQLSSGCSFVTEGTSSAEAGYRALERKIMNFHSVDIDPLVCPALPVCDPVVDDILVRLDHDHISAAWSLHIAPQLDELLTRLGVV